MDIPNWVTLVAELGFGGVITYIVYRLQSKTDKIRAAVTDQIKEYTEGKKKHEATRKKYYLGKVNEDLKYIKEADNRARTIINTFEKNRQLPSLFELIKEKHMIMAMCRRFEVYMNRLEPLFTNPQDWDEMMDGYLTVLDGPYDDLANPVYLQNREFIIRDINALLDIHLPEIDKYLKMLSKELAANVTNLTS